MVDVLATPRFGLLKIAKIAEGAPAKLDPKHRLIIPRPVYRKCLRHGLPHLSVLIGQLVHEVIDGTAVHLSPAELLSRFLDMLRKYVSRVFHESVPNYVDQCFLLVFW